MTHGQTQHARAQPLVCRGEKKSHVSQIRPYSPQEQQPNPKILGSFQ